MTPHEKLLQMGYRVSQETALHGTFYTIYEKDGASITFFDRKGGMSYKTKQEVNLELSTVLNDYLKWKGDGVQ